MLNSVGEGAGEYHILALLPWALRPGSDSSSIGRGSGMVQAPRGMHRSASRGPTLAGDRQRGTEHWEGRGSDIESKDTRVLILLAGSSPQASA